MEGVRAKRKRKPIKYRQHDYRTREGKLQRVVISLQLLRAEIAYATEKWERELQRIQEYIEPKPKPKKK